jgi:hypothetical protein
MDLDVAFALGDVDDTQLDGIARYGVWRLRPRRRAARWAEATAESRHPGCTWRLRAGARPRLAYSPGRAPIRSRWRATATRYCARAAEFAWRALRELHRSGHGWLEQCRLVEPQGDPAAPRRSRLRHRAHRWPAAAAASRRR